MRFAALSPTAKTLFLTTFLVLIALLPIALNPLGIGQDYPNHLARAYIYAAYDHEPFLQENYELVSILLPHLAMDLVVGWTIPFIGAYLAGQIFIALTLVLFVGSAFFLNWVLLKKVSPWPLFGLLALYSLPLEWGFVDFLFSASLAVGIFALWILSESWQPGWRIPLFAGLNLLLFFAHIVGFLFLGLLIVSYELGEAVVRRPFRPWLLAGQWGLKCLQFLLPLGLVVYAAVNWTSDTSISVTSFGSLKERWEGFLGAFLFYGAETIAIAMLFSLSAVIAVCWRLKLLTWDRRLFLPLLSIVILVVATPRITGGVWGIDIRFSALLFLILIAGAEFVGSKKSALWLAGLFLYAFILQQSNAHVQMARLDQAQQELREAFSQLKPGGALLTVTNAPVNSEGATGDCRFCTPHWYRKNHAPTLVAIESRAFTPELFSPLSRVRPAPRRRPMDVPFAWPLGVADFVRGKDLPLPEPNKTYDMDHPYWHGWPKSFDYVLWLNDGKEAMPSLAELESIHRGSYFEIFRVVTGE